MITPPPAWASENLVVADVEGNGNRPPQLVELAIVPINAGTIGDPASWLVRPATSITWQATRIHGISNTEVAALQPFTGVAEDVRAYLTDAVLVAHNAHVDLDVLTRELPGWQPTAVVDTLKLSRRVYPDRASHKLGSLVADLDLATNLPDGLRPHRATYDALATARLLLRLAADGGLNTLDELTLTSPVAEPDALF